MRLGPILIAAAVATCSGVALGFELGDIVMDRHATSSGVPAVVFPHWRHRARFRCYACHPQVFEMKAGANDISMDALRNREFCGKCHDGHTSFAIGFDTCRTCHSGPEPPTSTGP